MNDSIQLKGAIDVKMFDADGRLVQHEEKSNVVVTAGKTFLAAWLTGAQATAFMAYIGAGTGATAATASDTALVSEAFRKVGSVTSSLAVLSNSVTFGPGDGTGVIQEVGLFSAVSGGTMFARQVVSSFNKTASNSMVVTWQVTIS